MDQHYVLAADIGDDIYAYNGYGLRRLPWNFLD
jgi:hypothetical protein